MGKRRLKYYRVSTHENEHFSDANRAKSFGRCQLVQSYILEKTGKNRSRKQVSSHLQRLKKIHKDNPASLSCIVIVARCLLIPLLVSPLFSERSQPPPEHFSAPQAIAMASQDVFTNISVSTRHLKSDLDLAVNLQNTDTDNSSAFSYASEASSFNDSSSNRDALNLSTNFHDQASFFSQEFLSPVPQDTLHPSDSDYLSEFQDALLFKDAINEGFRVGSAFNTSAFSISMRHLASKLPIQGRLVDSGPTTHFSRALHSPGFQPTHQWISHDSLLDGVPCNSLLASAHEAFHTPLLPLQSIPPENRLNHGLASEWTWPQNPDIPLGPREGTYGEVRLRYPTAMYQYNPTYPEMRVNVPESDGSPSESEVSRLPRGISYSHAITSPATVSESGCPIDLSRQSSESSENLASPLVIRPTPVYPVSYIHSNIHSDDHTLAPSL